MGLNMKLQRKKLLAEINVVPYIDVMLVLLVIFMVTAPLLTEGVHVDLPAASAKVLPHQKEPIIVTVDKKGAYYFNLAANPKQPIAASILENRIIAELSADHTKQRPVMVKGDRDVSYQQIMELMVLLQRAGATQIGLVSENAIDPIKKNGAMVRL